MNNNDTLSHIEDDEINLLWDLKKSCILQKFVYNYNLNNLNRKQ